MEVVTKKRDASHPSNNTYQICRLCLKLTKSDIVINNWVMCMLKDCLPNLILDITEPPYKTCDQCFRVIKDFSSFLQMWKTSQNTLMGAYLKRKSKINLSEFKHYENHYSDFKAEDEKAKMFTTRDGILEMYKNPRVYTQYYDYFNWKNNELCDTMLFVLDANRRLMPVSKRQNLPRNIVLVPNCDIFNDKNLETKTYLIKITGNPLEETDGFAFVYTNTVKEQFALIIEKVLEKDFIVKQLTKGETEETQLQLNEEIQIKEEPQECVEIESGCETQFERKYVPDKYIKEVKKRNREKQSGSEFGVFKYKRMRTRPPPQIILSEHRLNKEGYNIDDHDYLAMPYKKWGIISGDLIYCSLCDRCHNVCDHKAHMGIHLTLRHCKEQTCSNLLFHNVYQSSLHHNRHKTKLPEFESVYLPEIKIEPDPDEISITEDPLL